MCTYVTEHVGIAGAGKGATGWFTLERASVYVDHPYRAPFEHSLNIDFLGERGDPSSRVAVELSIASARELIEAIEKAIEQSAALGTR
jgi:Family of unknown function (DUF6295)